MALAAVKIVGIVSLLLGLGLIIIVSIIAWVAVPDIVDKKIKEETRLIKDSETWDKWSDIKIPMRIKFYIFNIINPEVIENGTLHERLKFVEMGPYVYNEYRHKTDIVLSEDGEEVSYKQKILYLFNQEESTGSEDDLFNIPNIPLISVATAGYAEKDGADLNRVVALIYNLANKYGPERLIIKGVKVREILFEGMPLNSIYSLIPPEDFPPDFGTLKNMRFGLYKDKNGADDGQYVIKTGLNDETEFGKIVSWKQPGDASNPAQTELDWWYPYEVNGTDEQTHCNAINGSDGSLFPPFNDEETTLQLYQSDVCRSLHLTFNNEMEYRDIPGYRFTLPKNLFEAPAVNPDNECFCPHPSPHFPDRLAHTCVKGVIRIFPCKHGAPIVTSNPRFLHASEEIFEAIEIERPVQEQHSTFIEIEPESGMVLRASKKVQINVELQMIPKMELFMHLNFTGVTKAPSILLPVMWADETAELDHTSAKDLYDKLLKPQKLVDLIKWIVIGLGAFLVLVGILLIIVVRKMNNKK